MPDLPPEAPVFRTAALSPRKPTRFAWTAGPEARAALAADLGLLALYRLSFAGEIRPVGRADFRLEAQLTAALNQACGVTLAPVPAQVAEPVLRRYLAELAAPTADETEIPQDDSAEPMPEVIDIAALAAEALALALPPFPRAPGAALGEAVFAEPGVAPLRDADLNPFAALAGLRPKAPPDVPSEG